MAKSAVMLSSTYGTQGLGYWVLGIGLGSWFGYSVRARPTVKARARTRVIRFGVSVRVDLSTARVMGWMCAEIGSGPGLGSRSGLEVSVRARIRVRG